MGIPAWKTNSRVTRRTSSNSTTDFPTKKKANPTEGNYIRSGKGCKEYNSFLPFFPCSGDRYSPLET